MSREVSVTDARASQKSQQSQQKGRGGQAQNTATPTEQKMSTEEVGGAEVGTWDHTEGYPYAKKIGMRSEEEEEVKRTDRHQLKGIHKASSQ